MGLKREMRPVLVYLLSILIWILFNGCVQCQRPSLVNVGAVFGYNSIIGRVAKVALEAAVADVNADPTILSETQLNLIMEDVDCSVLLGSVKAFDLYEKEVVAMIGPQSSSVAHTISIIATSLQVPLISFAATDSALSSLEHPFFIRTTQSNSHQMAAMAELIHYYEWQEVIAIYVDNEYGRNGISILEDELAKKMSRISYKLGLPVEFNSNRITGLLNDSKLIGTRVYVVHLNPDSGLKILSIAKELEMMTSNYVWLATDWLFATLDSLPHIDDTARHVLQGVIGFRQHTLDTRQRKAFLSRWKEFQQGGLVKYELNTYGLNAYDTVWAVARALDEFLKEHGNVTFTQMEARILPQEMFKTFDGGTLLLRKLLNLNFTGLTGRIQFDVNRNLVGGGYEIINIDGSSLHRIGYWSYNTGFSVAAPETLPKEHHNLFRVDQNLDNVTWPGGKIDKPRGWVVEDGNMPLQIVVPNRTIFTEFVTEVNDNHKIQGYCIDVFNAARKLLSYDVPYTFKAFGDGHSNPNYNDLVELVARDVFDAAVGDIAIVTNRTKIVDFTQPYISGALVIVAPLNTEKSSTWVFLQPFTPELWCVTAASFVLIGVVVWFLEHRLNNDFRGPPRRQLSTIFLFSFSTMFKANREAIISTLGRLVMIVWLFLLMIIKASYTASLSSILTVQQLSPTLTGIEDLISSNMPIGYQVGSFALGYLKENYKLPHSRLVVLHTPKEYEIALRRGPTNGGVAAIVDELPYLELFLSKHSDFGVIGQPLTKNGWGFAFQKDSPLAVDMSTAILKLSENGELQKIHDQWFCSGGYSTVRRRDSKSRQLQLSSFGGLFLLFGAITVTIFLVFLLRTACLFARYNRKPMNPLSSASSNLSSSHFSQVMLKFVNFIDKKEGAVEKMQPCSDNSQTQASCSTV